jgi:nucleoside 2-deoxyribosyltransferase
VKIYLAARFGRRDELREIARTLRRMGYTVMSSWLEQEEDAIESPDSPHLAGLDLREIGESDVFVAFTDHPGTPGAERGGRHVEFGAAAALGKGIIICGPVEHIFHRLPSVVRVGSVMRLLDHLATADRPVGAA